MMKKFLLVLIPVLILYFYNLGYNAVWMPNESFYADSAKNMLKSGEFLTPVYNGEIRLNKPPMTYWIVSLGYKIFGVNELGLRFFHALLGVFTGVLTYLLARRITGSKNTALLSFLILSLSFIFIANARYASPEVPFTFFITLSLYLWYEYFTRKKEFLFWLALIASSLAVLTKGPAGFVLPAGVVFFYLLLRAPKELLKIKYYAGTLMVFLLSGWWFLYQYLVHREEFLEVFIKENVKRIYALQRDPFYFYALDINVSFLPYSFLFFFALFWALKEKRRELSFPLVWFSFIFLIFSIVKMKIPVYIMPAYPAMAIITADFLNSQSLKKVKNLSLIFLWTVLVLATLALSLYFKFSATLFPLIPLLLLPFFLKKYELLPAFGAFAFLFYLSSVILPYVEQFRPYREVGKEIRKLDPKNELRTYELGFFHHNLPFYADRVIIRRTKEVKKPAIVLARKGSFDCEPVRKWELYTSSESRFFKFMLDIKRKKRFEEFLLCVIK
ncbi:putative protein [Aquifex aeolicus VF5]|uniref:Uncharacterized protein aq_1220 n=2 Tax=Aquifex aeolicus TaxID=63363 RepID=Y1220_AQUAE|nr:RecName: Full=Uncharacterized protein aq_1220 [Aquifex aeolicus VF5]AAC07235.1 putative protein [Aquifex aeolicus VF5]